MSNESVMVAAARVDALGGAGASFPLVDRQPRPHVVAARDAVGAAVSIAAADALAEAQAWADAQMIVGRAMKRGGRDPLAVQVTDSQALRSIANLLISVRETGEETPPDALRIAIERGEAVAKAIAGEG